MYKRCTITYKMTPPSEENSGTKFTAQEKAELLKKIELLEGRYGNLDKKHNALVVKYQEEVVKKC